MHIGLVSPFWPLRRQPNGIVTYVHQLREELMRQGHRVSVFTQRSSGGAEPGVHVVAPTLGFRLRRRVSSVLGAGREGSLDWGPLIAAKIAEVHRSDPLDVLEMEETFGWCADVHRLQPVPVVVKLHGPACLTLLPGERDRPAGRRRIAAEGDALRAVPVLVSPSRRTLEQTVAHYGLTPAFSAVVPNPMSVDPALELWDERGCEPKALLFVGRFDALKGGDIMLLAFRRLLDHEPDARLIFVGPDLGIAADGGPRIRFDDFCARHFSAAQRARIDYRGALPREQIFALRKQAAVTVISSRFDNQPNTALEAMIQASPVVAVDSGGVGELIEHGVSGRLARPGDIDDLCTQLRAVLSDLPAAARMGRAARDVVLQRHSLGKLTAQALEVYRRAIALGSGSPSGTPVDPLPPVTTAAGTAQPSGARVDLSVVVVNYNTAHLLGEMFAALGAATHGLAVQVIVVDNASRDGSAALIREHYPDVELIENRTNVGFGRANNQAIPLLRGDHVLLLNTDAFVAADTLAKTLAYMKSHPDCGVLGVRLVGRDGHQQPSCRYFPTPINLFLMRTGLARWFPWVRGIDDPRWNPAAGADCDWVPGCYYLMPRTVIERVGLFDPRYFLYCEEVDHCKRVKQAGWTVRYFADTTVVHIGGESAKSDSPLTESGRQISALQIESELLFFRKHHGLAGMWTAMALTAIADAYLALKWIAKRRDVAGTRPYWKHAGTTWSLLRQTARGTRPTR